MGLLSCLLMSETEARASVFERFRGPDLVHAWPMAGLWAVGSEARVVVEVVGVVHVFAAKDAVATNFAKWMSICVLGVRYVAHWAVGVFAAWATVARLVAGALTGLGSRFE